MIFDCFPFYNEMDMLIRHLEWYEDIVDYTVICESNLTFSGKPKPLWLVEYPEILHKYAKQDVLHVAYQVEEDEVMTPWEREFRHRDAMYDIMKHHHEASNGDIMLINDIDEFVNIDALANLSMALNAPTTMIMDHYQGSFKCKIAKPWPGTVVAPWESLEEHKPHIYRDQRNQLPYCWGGGWHLSYFGGVQAIQQKFSAYSHVELDTDHNKDAKRLQKALDEGTPILENDIQDIQWWMAKDKQ
jgi:beta-1,4-mannosyl-glycoprotein beta-1,4-N-acetylglucosaminyltransferase